MSAVEFMRALASSNPSSPRRPDRRRERRIARADSVIVFPCPDGILGNSMWASFVDLSGSGVGLTCLGGLPLGARFILRLEQPTGGPLMRLFEVVRVRDAGAGTCFVGGKFLRDLK